MNYEWIAITILFIFMALLYVTISNHVKNLYELMVVSVSELKKIKDRIDKADIPEYSEEDDEQCGEQPARRGDREAWTVVHGGREPDSDDRKDTL